ncbi:MAG: Mur ligase family protein [Oscillospiraceae bacterium]|nr:Mur ligase family protein [Oscillospiraceae bacterium]
MNINKYLEQFEKFTKDPTLKAMEYTMERSGSPHKSMKYVHVAGTNGKGSVCEMLNNVLIEAGYKVGKFVSPHLIRFNDGICINNVEISDEEIEEIIGPMSKIIEQYNKENEIQVKWFEVISSAALIYFAKKDCDIAVIETGMGGTWDCTNIIDPIVSVITKIGYDHTDILGSTIEEIAGHKAGIIKENSHTVFFYQEDAVEIIKNACDAKHNQLHLIKEEDISNYRYDGSFQIFNYKEYKNTKINLKGKAQIKNAAECLECVNILKSKGYKISDEAVRKGLSTVIHKARLEFLSENPLIIFDGAHNESAIINLRESIDLYYKDYPKKVYIVSILKTKDYKTVISRLCENNNAIFIFTNGIDKEKYVSNIDLYNAAKQYINEDKLYMEELEDAALLIKEKYSDSLNLIIGSFYIYKKVCELLI